jgi:DNA-binding transcriptional LysR family regulator
MKLMPSDWGLIGAYLAVRRHGSLSAAARALRLSQPTVRRQIEELEQHLGTNLFTRDTSGLEPIATSESLVDLAETMEAAALAFERAAHDDATSAKGTVRISCSTVFGTEILPPILTKLRSTHPALVIELAVTNRVDDILRHEADIAVRLVKPEQDRIVARKVAPIAIGLYAAPGPVAKAVKAMDYNAFCAIGPMISDDKRDLVERGFRALGRTLPSNIVLRTDDDLAQLAAIRAGVGVGVCQRSVAERSGLVRVFPKLELRLDVWVVTHEDLRHVARIRTVFDAIVAGLS